VTISYALLRLLEGASRHGYDLRQSYDRRFGGTKPIRLGQVYRTLAQPRPAAVYLDAQRAKHLAAMRALTIARRRAASTQDVVLADYRLFHIEADLRWLDHTESRLSTLAQEVSDVPGPDRA
jgi:hypothetical protein